jgi:hypothetical protein
MNQKCNKSKPNMSDLVISLQKEQKIFRLKYTQLQNGYGKLKGLKIRKDLKAAAENFKNYEVLEYFEIINNKFHWKFE